jgi:hypothetical protein
VNRLKQLAVRKKRSRPTSPHRQIETTGVLLIAILILAITITRYWHNINWSTR